MRVVVGSVIIAMCAVGSAGPSWNASTSDSAPLITKPRNGSSGTAHSHWAAVPLERMRRDGHVLQKR